MSKGSNRRPAVVPSSVVDERWARTFGRHHADPTPPLDAPSTKSVARARRKRGTDTIAGAFRAAYPLPDPPTPNESPPPPFCIVWPNREECGYVVGPLGAA